MSISTSAFVWAVLLLQILRQLKFNTYSPKWRIEFVWSVERIFACQHTVPHQASHWIAKPSLFTIPGQNMHIEYSIYASCMPQTRSQPIFRIFSRYSHTCHSGTSSNESNSVRTISKYTSHILPSARSARIKPQWNYQESKLLILSSIGYLSQKIRTRNVAGRCASAFEFECSTPTHSTGFRPGFVGERAQRNVKRSSCTYDNEQQMGWLS